MRAVVDFLKKAVDREGQGGCYVFKGGMVYANGHEFKAGAPFKLGADANLPAAEVEAVLGRMSGEPAVKIKDGVITMTQGRLRQTMRSVPGADDFEQTELGESGWLPAPARFAEALHCAAKFVGERGWVACVRLGNGRITAITNRAGIDIELPAFAMDADALISGGAATYIAENGPEHYRVRPAPDGQPNSMLFKWGSGQWLRAQFIQDKFQDVDRLFADRDGMVRYAVDDELRAAWADAAAVTEQPVVLLHDRFMAYRTGSVVEVAAKTGLPKGHQSKWMKEVLDLVMPLAEWWDPTGYPESCRFGGAGFRGVFLGIK